MIPQTPFMIVAEVEPGREVALRELLAGMNREPGVVDPLNAVVPFAMLRNLHFARFAILKDETADDITVYGQPRPQFPIYLVFLGDVDGEPDTLFARLVDRAAPGLSRIYSHCKGFPDGPGPSELFDWLTAHDSRPAANYVNWLGRTVSQVEDERELHQALATYMRENAEWFHAMAPQQVLGTLQRFALNERRQGRLLLLPPEEDPTPLYWQLKNILHLVGVPFLLVIALPLLLLYLPFFLIVLRRREKSDPVIAPRVDPAHAEELAVQEDKDVTNQFTAFGSLKPGLFRLTTIAFVLLLIDYAARHIFNRGRLARVTTIHFARWAYFDRGKRVLFASNYDGSLESYMDDFINKVGFGLNLAFGNGLGYPRTNWLILDGAKDELAFKNYLRRHQLPTQVWYSAHPGLTALDKRRNMLIREGLEKESMTDDEIQQWLDLF